MSTNLHVFGAGLHSLAIHKVGNKQRAEKNFVSSQLFNFEGDIKYYLRDYYLKAMKKATDWYQFTHSAELKYNEVFGYCDQIFANPNANLYICSTHLLHHLYNQSNHPNIKSGEFHVAYFQDVLVDDELVDAIGIFKTEEKSNFLTIDEDGQNLVLDVQQGFSFSKLDKGCLIVNVAKSEGYRVLTIDNNNYDALYWTHHFLNIKMVENETYFTKIAIEALHDFGKTVIPEHLENVDGIAFGSDVADYLSTHEQFDFDEFADTVLRNEVLKEALLEKFEEYDVEEDFQIDQSETKKATKKWRRKVKLDTGVSIDFRELKAAGEFVKKEFDSEKGMYCYRIYFNEED